ncbi:MAG: hypothetical protein DI537_38420 [Stutzerimonas stutzeri]|nr:MAG: hypothetical protein DI537_38420 [Stutzerimonas stutzeri]
MSLIEFKPRRLASAPYPSARQVLPALQCELEGLDLNLTPAERGDVREILDLVTTRLCQKAETMASARRRLDAIVSDLIATMDLIDGDGDLETGTATETHGRGFHWTPLFSLDDDEDGNDDEPLEAADA